MLRLSRAIPATRIRRLKSAVVCLSRRSRVSRARRSHATQTMCNGETTGLRACRRLLANAFIVELGAPVESIRTVHSTGLNCPTRDASRDRHAIPPTIALLLYAAAFTFRLDTDLSAFRISPFRHGIQMDMAL